MRNNRGRIVAASLFMFFSLILFFPSTTLMAETDYSFDTEEFEPKPFDWGGYAEIKFEQINLNTDAAFYGLNFYTDPHSSIDRVGGALQLAGRYKKGIAAFNSVLRAEAGQDNIGWSDTVDVFEANLSLKPRPFVSVDLGKKVFKWGKGYAWANGC